MSFEQALAEGRVYVRPITTYVVGSESDDAFFQRVIAEELAEASHRIGDRLNKSGFKSYAVSAGEVLHGRMENGQLSMDPKA